MMNALLSIGPLALLAAWIAVPLFYLAYRSAPKTRPTLSLLRYLLTTLAVGAAAYVGGTAVGIAVACSSDKAGNLCGLVGVFGTGPLLSAVAMIIYAHAATRRARREG